jgi:hypothetical protein
MLVTVKCLMASSHPNTMGETSIATHEFPARPSIRAFLGKGGSLRCSPIIEFNVTNSLLNFKHHGLCRMKMHREEGRTFEETEGWESGIAIGWGGASLKAWDP